MLTLVMVAGMTVCVCVQCVCVYERERAPDVNMGAGFHVKLTEACLSHREYR